MCFLGIVDWKKYAWVRRGKRRLETLMVLYKENRPLTVNDIHVRSKIAISQASATITELLEANLVKCLNPEDKIGRLYTISDEGKKIINQLEDRGIE